MKFLQNLSILLISFPRNIIMLLFLLFSTDLSVFGLSAELHKIKLHQFSWCFLLNIQFLARFQVNLILFKGILLSILLVFRLFYNAQRKNYLLFTLIEFKLNFHRKLNGWMWVEKIYIFVDEYFKLLLM